jgi:hypothetical protein
VSLLVVGLIRIRPDAGLAASVPPATLPAASRPAETVGGGTVTDPAVGPAPYFGIGGPGMVLVKNWHFGTGGTIKNYDDMSANFLYHDQFNTIGNGTNYGALTVAHDKATALYHQPIEGEDSPPVREFTADSLKTYLTGLDGAALCKPYAHNAGCGSFMAKWKLPKENGPLPGRDIVWETRVRYVTPKYFWFAIWTAGNKWKADKLGLRQRRGAAVHQFRRSGVALQFSRQPDEGHRRLQRLVQDDGQQGNQVVRRHAVPRLDVGIQPRRDVRDVRRRDQSAERIALLLDLRGR